MHPLRTRLVRDMLPIVVAALALVGALSLGMTAVGSVMAGHSWMTDSAHALVSLLDTAAADQRVVTARLAAGPAPRPPSGDGLVRWGVSGVDVEGLPDTVADAVRDLDPADEVQLVTAGGGAWLVTAAPAAPPLRAVGVVHPIDDVLAQTLASFQRVEVELWADGRVVASSWRDVDGRPVRPALPDAVRTWAPTPEAPTLSGAATFDVPRYRGLFPDGEQTFLAGADHVPTFYGATELPTAVGPPLRLVVAIPRAVMLEGPERGGLVFLGLSVVVTIGAVALLVRAAARHLGPVFRGVARLREASRDLAHHLGLTLPEDDDDDLYGVESVARALDRSIAQAVEVSLSLANARDRAMEASALKSRFLANVSHELRTPLTAILGYTELLREDAEGALATDLARVGSAASQLLALVDDVLDLARIEAGKVVLEEAPFDLPALLEEVHALALPLAERRANRLTVRAGRAGDWTGDRARIRQILLNLVGNAAKFTAGGEIVLGATPTAQGLALEVRDTGIGIAPDRLPTLFQPFVQAHRSTEVRAHGTGLGLAICAQYAALMGGTVSVVSDVGQGSTFTLTLPDRTRARPAA